MKNLYRLFRYGPRLYRAARRLGGSRGHALWIVLFPAIAALGFACACGGAEFQPVIDDVPDAGGASDAIAPVDAASDAAAGGDVVAIDAGSTLDARTDGPLCCVWLDAGAHATACNQGDWACVVEGGADARAMFSTCYETPSCLEGDFGGACVLNDGHVFGTIENCP